MKSKIKNWYNFVSTSKIVNSGTEVLTACPRPNGTYVTYSYIIQILSGSKKPPLYLLKGMIDHYYFTPENYFKGHGPIVHWQELFRWLCEKFDIKKIDVTKKIGLTNSAVAKWDNNTSDRQWQLIFDFFNENYNTAIDVDNTNQTGIIQRKYVSLQAERLVKFVDFLKENNQVSTYKEFAENIGISEQHFSNIRHIKAKQDVTKDMLVGVATKYKMVNIRYLLGVSDEMFLKPADIIPSQSTSELIELLNRLNDKYSKLEEKYEKLTKP